MEEKEPKLPAVRSIAWLDVLVSVAIYLSHGDVINLVNMNVQESIVHPLEYPEPIPASDTVFIDPPVGKRLSARAAPVPNTIGRPKQLYNSLFKHTGPYDPPNNITRHCSASITTETCTAVAPRFGGETLVVKGVKWIANQRVYHDSRKNDGADDPYPAT